MLLISERGLIGMCAWWLWGWVWVCAHNKSKYLDAFEWFVEFGGYACE